jgi:hypothetical protein
MPVHIRGGIGSTDTFEDVGKTVSIGVFRRFALVLSGGSDLDYQLLTSFSF